MLNRIETWDPNPFPPGMNWGIPGTGVTPTEASASGRRPRIAAKALKEAGI